MSVGTAVTVPIINLFSTNTPLLVPDWQRDFSWSKSEIEDYWNDLITIYKDSSKNAAHFLGAIVLCQSEDEKSKLIIDGQQRITTTFLIMYRIITIARKLQESEPNSFPNYQSSLDFWSQHLAKLQGMLNFTERTRSLKLNSRNDKYFNNMLDNNISSCTEEEKKANETLFKADNYIKELIEAHISELDSIYEQVVDLSSLLLTIEKKMEIILFEATDQTNANKVFETLNARGKDLEVADLIKNWLYSLSINSQNLQSQINSSWSTLASACVTSKNITKYIRYYWNATQSYTGDSDLYTSIRNYIGNSITKAQTLLSELVFCSNIFETFTKNNVLAYSSNKMQNLVNEARILKVSTFIPIMISLKLRPDIAESQIAEVLKNILNYLMRVTIIPGGGAAANKNERLFSNIARDIYINKCTIDQIKKALKDADVSDETVTAQFMDYAKKDKNTARYILGKINDYYDPSNTFDFKTSDKVNIEHIFPGKPDSSWPVLSEEEKVYIDYIGNKTLWSATDNKSLQNKCFSEKQELYKECSAVITKQLYNETNWNIVEIKARQKKFAEIAPKIWKLD